MDWWKEKRLRAIVRKQRLVREREIGGILLQELVKCCDGKSNPIKFFSIDQIRKAMDDICKCNSLSQRRPNICKCSHVSQLSNEDHVKWYSGKLDDHRMILINTLVYEIPNCGTPNYPSKFCRDIVISSMLSGHKNFLKLIGCCFEWSFPIMVYYGEKKQYSRIDLSKIVLWRRRMKIAEEIAIALAYLHTAFSRPFVYANMCLHNIILDENGIVKLCDFSNCVSIPQGETFVKVDSGWGDYDYMDDDYVFNHVISEKTDAYGFGVLMQKLLTGEEERFNDLNKFPNRLSKSIEEGGIDKIVDPKMLVNMGGEVTDKELCRMESFIVLSERCIGLRGEFPKMVEVAKELKKLLKDSSSTENETLIDSAQHTSSSVLPPNQM